MIRLLIVDDEQTTREGLLNYVEWDNMGIEMVKTAEDGWEALQLCSSFRPDIVLTDVKMPRMDGIQFAIRLKAIQPHCKILFLSSYADKEYLKSAIHLKALDYIEKPVNLDNIREYISHAVEICLEEQRVELAEKHVRNISELLKQEQYALYWITRYANDGKEITASPEVPPLQAGANFAAAIIKIHNPLESDLQHLLLHKNDILEKIGLRFSAFGLETLRGFKDSQHLIIHAYSRNLAAPEELVPPLAQVRSDLQQLLHKPLLSFIGIGHLVHQPQRLIDSYYTAAVTIQRQFFTGYNQIVVFREARRTPDGELPGRDALTPAFLTSLQEEKQDEAFEVLARAASILKANEDTLVNDAKNMFFDLLLILFRAADQKKIHLADSLQDKEYLWNVLFQFNTLQEIMSYTEDKLNYFFEQLHEQPAGGSIVSNICKFVRVHYENPNLSIKMIAEHLFLTPNYLSLQFKKETGMTINQYITDYRIGKAKELLADQHRKLYEVAAHVGIQDANYFAKTFKKVTGMTPSEFKEKHT
ncbi:response regulator transcription factor [Paenibacillus sp. HW567]|uniref:response regulator transcription factor n=1 Tax=Paenibacillus sp. HW567 TaxID=1034769 RepID=UPI0003641BA1|nr:response regulator [Paenibacillus sp. HW567]